MDRNKILCPYCKKIGNISHHHILPKRYFGNVGKLITICRKCHDILERMIRDAEVLPAERYIEIFEEFERRSYERVNKTIWRTNRRKKEAFS